MRHPFSYARLFALQHGRCFYCHTVLDNFPYANKNKRRHGWTKDHFLPKCLGYGLTGNVVLACKTCNARKGDSIPHPTLFVKMVLIRSHFVDGVLPEILDYLETDRLIQLLRFR